MWSPDERGPYDLPVSRLTKARFVSKRAKGPMRFRVRRSPSTLHVESRDSAGDLAGCERSHADASLCKIHWQALILLALLR
jgi:hypothetical protein